MDTLPFELARLRAQVLILEALAPFAPHERAGVLSGAVARLAAAERWTPEQLQHATGDLTSVAGLIPDRPSAPAPVAEEPEITREWDADFRPAQAVTDSVTPPVTTAVTPPSPDPRPTIPPPPPPPARPPPPPPPDPGPPAAPAPARFTGGKGRSPRQDAVVDLARAAGEKGITADDVATAFSLTKTNAHNLVRIVREAGRVMVKPGTTYHPRGNANSEPNTYVTPEVAARLKPSGAPAPIRAVPPPPPKAAEPPPPTARQPISDPRTPPPPSKVRAAPEPPAPPIAPRKVSSPLVQMVADAVRDLERPAYPVTIMRRLEEWADGTGKTEAGKRWRSTAKMARRGFSLVWVNEMLIDASAAGLIRQLDVGRGQIGGQRWVAAELAPPATPHGEREIHESAARAAAVVKGPTTIDDLAKALGVEKGSATRAARRAVEAHLLREEPEDVYSPVAQATVEIAALAPIEQSALSFVRSSGRTKAGQVATALSKPLELVKDSLRRLKDVGLLEATVEDGLNFYSVSPGGFAAFARAEVAAAADKMRAATA